MGLINTVNHLLNFIAPALVVAILTAWMGRRLLSVKAAAPRFRLLTTVGWVAGTVVLVAGSWFFGRDGKMATYLAMVLACATAQWAVARARKGRPDPNAWSTGGGSRICWW